MINDPVIPRNSNIVEMDMKPPFCNSYFYCEIENRETRLSPLTHYLLLSAKDKRLPTGFRE